MLNDSPQSMTSFLRRIRPILEASAGAWHLDLTKCTYIGPDAAAILVATHLDAVMRGVEARVTLPSGNPALDAFLKFSGVAHYLTGVPLPQSDPDLVIPVRVQTRASFNDPDPIIKLISRHASLEVDTEEYLRICINEVVQNVEDHAESPVGCVTCARFLKNVGEVRVAIVDRGRGIGTTLREKHPGIKSTAEAMQRVIEGGYSAKSRPTNQGLGVSNLSNIVIRQLNGELFIVSEDAFADGKSGRLPFARLSGVRFQGTGVFFSVPLA
jgi:hypothetical protein